MAHEPLIFLLGELARDIRDHMSIYVLLDAIYLPEIKRLLPPDVKPPIQTFMYNEACYAQLWDPPMVAGRPQSRATTLIGIDQELLNEDRGHPEQSNWYRRVAAETLERWQRWAASGLAVPSQPIFRVDSQQCYALLGEKRFELSADQTEFLKELANAKGAPISYSGRPDRIIAKLPIELQEIIDKKPGAGCWLRVENVALE